MDTTTSLNELVASEIRAWLGRRRLTGRQLAAKIGASQTWTATRLRGEQEITLNDLERIADALDVEIAALLPSTVNKTYSPPPVRTTGPRSQRVLLAPGHALERHPNDRPASAMSGAEQAELRRPAITRRTHSGSST
jgi:transcriptional regulator with XRE-family HTH domain